MDKLFLSILNMSLTGAFVIAAVMLARLPLKKAPKIISYCLWAVVGFRLAVPFTFESVFSLIPFKASPIPAGIAMQAVPRIDSGINIIDNAISSVLPAAAPYHSANPLQIWVSISSYVWLVGIFVMLLYSILSIVLLKQRLQSAGNAGDSIYETGNLKTPLILGLFRPKIYIPAGLAGEERRYILLHEQTHIKRRDHLVKLFAFLLLCIHWFNPLSWVAFLLVCADMEMSCDERVMKELGGKIKHNYSLSLVHMSTGRHILNCSPLAFGEGGMKERVKNVLNFKKPSRWVVLVAVLLVAVLTVGFAVNSSAKSPNTPEDAVRAYLTDPVNIEKFGEGKDDEMNVIDLWETHIKPGNYNGVVIAAQDENTAYVDSTYQTAKTNMAYYKCMFVLKRENTGSPWAVREYYNSILFEDPDTTPVPSITPSASIPPKTTISETVASIDTSNWQSVVKSKFGIDLSLPDGWIIIGAADPSFTDLSFTRLTFTTGGSTTAEEFGTMVFDATKAISIKGNADVKNGTALETFADATTWKGFSTWVFALPDNSMKNYIVRVFWSDITDKLTVSIA